MIIRLVTSIVFVLNAKNFSARKLLPLCGALKKSPACAGLCSLVNRKLLLRAASLHIPNIIVVRVADLEERVTECIIRQCLVDLAAGRH